MNVKFVLMDMKTRQNVLQPHHLFNQLKLEMYQLDQLKYLIVLTNLKPAMVPQFNLC